MEVIDSSYDFYLTFAIDCLATNLSSTIKSSSYSSNACREIGASQCRLGNATLNGKSLGCGALLDSGLRGGGCWHEPPDCPEAPGRDKSVLCTAPRWTMWVEKKMQNQGNLGEEMFKKKAGGGKCQLVLNLPVPRLLTVLGCCACC